MTTGFSEAGNTAGNHESLVNQGERSVPPSLKRFIWDIQSMVELADDEREILVIGRDLMARLVATDDWLPPAFARPDPARPQQFQLYADGLERFSIVATVLAAGQALPVALYPVWEIMGVLRGAMTLGHYGATDGDKLAQKGDTCVLPQGKIETFRSISRDITRLGNHLGDAVSITVHVYGGEMGTHAHQRFTPAGEKTDEVIAYVNPADAPPYDIFSIQTRITD